MPDRIGRYTAVECGLLTEQLPNPLDRFDWRAFVGNVALRWFGDDLEPGEQCRGHWQNWPKLLVLSSARRIEIDPPVYLIKLCAAELQNSTRPRKSVTSDNKVCENVPRLCGIKQSCHFHGYNW